MLETNPMSVTQEQLDDFHRFATERLNNGSSEVSFDDLVIEWDSVRNRDEINAAIRQGLDDIDAGRHRPADEVMEELRKKHNIPSE